MREAIERAANISVGRACGFCALATFCFMAGFAYQPHLSAQVGGTFALIVAIALMLKAWWAPRFRYTQTETWLMLREEDKPAPAEAQQLIATVLRRVYLIYAGYCAVAALVLITASILLSR
jgi:hypothetical protein